MYVCAFVCVFVYYIFVLYNWFSCAVRTEWYTGAPSLVKAYIPYKRISDTGSCKEEYKTDTGLGGK